MPSQNGAMFYQYSAALTANETEIYHYGNVIGVQCLCAESLFKILFNDQTSVLPEVGRPAPSSGLSEMILGETI
ncbi:UNVERIFIED_CONTAM: hypothetical protein QE602_10605 [Streptococcus suis]|jgi:hypothetical protein|tara:strand:+ start:3085 stop:3306 length:222 start_codon:yes stop_codon:yes gene_type:complete